MKNFRGIIAMVGLAIAIGAMAGTAANAAIVPTVVSKQPPTSIPRTGVIRPVR